MHSPTELRSSGSLLEVNVNLRPSVSRENSKHHNNIALRGFFILNLPFPHWIETLSWDIHLCLTKNGIHNYTVYLLHFLNEGDCGRPFLLDYHKGIILAKLHKENGACWPRLWMGVHSQRQKKRKAFQMATLFIPDCLHIITVNPSQLFSSGTFVAKGKLKKSNCVDAPLGASLWVSDRFWRLHPETSSIAGVGGRQGGGQEPRLRDVTMWMCIWAP